MLRLASRLSSSFAAPRMSACVVLHTTARCVTFTSGSGGAAAARDRDGSGAEAARRMRAEEIRRQEQWLRWLRALVIPAFTLYGLFILRPTEGHFLRYLAERRHLDPSFNALFPPLTRNGEEMARASTGGRPPNGAGAPSGDSDWLRRRLHAESDEDEARVARRKLLFAREHNFSAAAGDDGQVPVVVKSAEQRRRELEEQREHPPMHMLGDQLNTIASMSREYRERQASLAMQTGAQAAAPPAAPPPPIEISFHDRTFFATASVALHGPNGEAIKTMRFAGACGMMWKQIA